MNPSCQPAAAALNAASLPGERLRPAAMAQALWLQLGAILRNWRHRSRSRNELRGLDARMLRDIGLTRAQTMSEAEKPFWRA